MPGEGRGGVNWVLQDWQGSVRASVNSNGFISARFDFSAFGEKISLGVGLRSIDQGYSAPTNARQGYGLTETETATDRYVKKVADLNSNTFWGWVDNSAFYTAGSLGVPTSIGAFRDAMNSPGAKVQYGWGPSITIHGKRANPPSVPGGRITFWANFSLQTGAYIRLQGSANQTSAELFDLYTGEYFGERNKCINDNPYDAIIFDP